MNVNDDNDNDDDGDVVHLHLVDVLGHLLHPDQSLDQVLVLVGVNVGQIL